MTYKPALAARTSQKDALFGKLRVANKATDVSFLFSPLAFFGVYLSLGTSARPARPAGRTLVSRRFIMSRRKRGAHEQEPKTMPLSELFDRFINYIKTADALNKFVSWLTIGFSGIFVFIYQYPLLAAIALPILTIIVYSLILILILRHKYSSSKEHNAYVKSTNRLLRIWRDNAATYAAYELSIFEHLFLDEAAGNHDEAIYEQAEKCIYDILNRTAHAFEVITGDKCAVTIKAAIIKNDALQTMYRDVASAHSRGTLRDRNTHHLSENTSMISVAHGDPLYANDDLKAASDRGEYKNSRVDWRKFYNAEIVYPIKIYANKRKYTEETSGLSDTIFLLGVDNMKGKFDQEISREMIVYISNRISAMLYRAEILKLKSLRKQGTK